MSIAERLRLEKELETLVDDMPTVALQILVEYTKRLKAAYAAKQDENEQQR
jgi:hypothetical protein